MPPQDDRARCLAELGATELWWHEAAGKDGSEWVRFRYDGELVEIGWQAVDALEQTAAALAAGGPAGLRLLGMGWVLQHGVALVGGETFDAARTMVNPYPESLARLVAGATIANHWLDPEERRGLWSLVAREQWLKLESTLLADVQAVLRVMFAVNREYEPPSWKWLEQEVARLDDAPADFVARLRVVAGSNNATARDRVRTALELEVEVVSLAAPISSITLDDTPLRAVALEPRPPASHTGVGEGGPPRPETSPNS